MIVQKSEQVIMKDLKLSPIKKFCTKCMNSVSVTLLSVIYTNIF